MRQVLSLSLPTATAKEIKMLSKKRGFASVSEYVKKLVELDSDLIPLEDLLSDVKSARRDYKTGKAIKAGSLADLL